MSKHPHKRLEYESQSPLSDSPTQILLPPVPPPSLEDNEEKVAAILQRCLEIFPFSPPFASQLDSMKSIIKSLVSSSNLLFQSPTGTGKTLITLCASLAYIDLSNDQSMKLVVLTRTNEQQNGFIKEINKIHNYPNINKYAILTGRGSLCLKKTEFQHQFLEKSIKPKKFQGYIDRSCMDCISQPRISKSSQSAITSKGKLNFSQPYQQQHNNDLTDNNNTSISSLTAFQQSSNNDNSSSQTRLYNIPSAASLLSKTHSSSSSSASSSPIRMPQQSKGIQRTQSSKNSCMHYEIMKRDMQSIHSNSPLDLSIELAYPRVTFDGNGSTRLPDIEDIRVLFESEQLGCPYWHNKFAVASAKIVFCTYIYAINPSILEGIAEQFRSNRLIILFDEAHNVLDQAEAVEKQVLTAKKFHSITSTLSVCQEFSQTYLGLQSTFEAYFEAKAKEELRQLTQFIRTPSLLIDIPESPDDPQYLLNSTINETQENNKNKHNIFDFNYSKFKEHRLLFHTLSDPSSVDLFASITRIIATLKHNNNNNQSQEQQQSHYLQRKDSQESEEPNLPLEQSCKDFIDSLLKKNKDQLISKEDKLDLQRQLESTYIKERIAQFHEWSKNINEGFKYFIPINSYFHRCLPVCDPNQNIQPKLHSNMNSKHKNEDQHNYRPFSYLLRSQSMNSLYLSMQIDCLEKQGIHSKNDLQAIMHQNIQNIARLKQLLLDVQQHLSSMISCEGQCKQLSEYSSKLSKKKYLQYMQILSTLYSSYLDDKDYQFQEDGSGETESESSDRYFALSEYIDSRSISQLKFEMGCLSARRVFARIQSKMNINSFIFTSGTLKPFEIFEKSIRLSAIVNKHDAPHLVDADSNIFTQFISKHESTEIKLSVEHMKSNGINVKNAAMKIVSDILAVYINNNNNKEEQVFEQLSTNKSVEKGGIVVFFKSKKMLEEFRIEFNRGQFRDQFQGKLLIFIESDPAGEFKKDFEEYKAHLSLNNTHCMFLAVHRGKISEGIDLKDALCRVVLLIGVPFPPYFDPSIMCKRAYMQSFVNEPHWYEKETVKVVNQAAGRCIRHKDDWGSIFFIDSMFKKSKEIKKNISNWILASRGCSFDDREDWKTRFNSFLNRRKIQQYM